MSAPAQLTGPRAACSSPSRHLPPLAPALLPTTCCLHPPLLSTCSAIPMRFKPGVEGPEGVEVLLISSRRGKGYVFPKVR